MWLHNATDQSAHKRIAKQFKNFAKQRTETVVWQSHAEKKRLIDQQERSLLRGIRQDDLTVIYDKRLFVP
eukprot:UN18459